MSFRADRSTESSDWFWRTVEARRWEPATLDALRAILRPGDRVLDVGAWIGPVTLFAAALGAHVDAYEPDPVALEQLIANVHANPELAQRVTIHAVALSRRDGTAELAAGAAGDSGSSLVRRATHHVNVEVRDVSRESPKIRQARLVKIDVEGAEYELVPRLASDLRAGRACLHLSIHTYHLRERFAHQPWLIRGVLRRLVTWPKLFRLVYLVQGLGEVLVVTPQGSWTRLTLRRKLKVLVAARESELLVVPEPALASRVLDLPS